MICADDENRKPYCRKTQVFHKKIANNRQYDLLFMSDYEQQKANFVMPAYGLCRFEYLFIRPCDFRVRLMHSIHSTSKKENMEKLHDTLAAKKLWLHHGKKRICICEKKNKQPRIFVLDGEMRFCICNGVRLSLTLGFHRKKGGEHMEDFFLIFDFAWFSFPIPVLPQDPTKTRAVAASLRWTPKRVCSGWAVCPL